MTIAITLSGPPGSGKSTLAQGVAEALGLPIISSGNIAREMQKNNASVKADLERGEWAPELAMRTEVLARIEAAMVTSGDFIIEGFPRRLEQLYILEQVPGIRPLYTVLSCDPLICLRRLILRGRNGDHPDAVAVRWRTWEEHTLPMLAMVADHTVDLNGQLDPQILIEEVVTAYQRERDR